MSKLVNIKLHGNLGETIGENWNLSVLSVGEAIRAIQVLNGKLYKYLIDKDKEGAKYKVLINGRDFKYEKEPNLDDLDSINNSELAMKSKKLQTIDIVPVYEGAGDVGLIIVGALLVIVSFGVAAPLLAGALFIAGAGLIAAGVINLLSSPPKFDDFRQITNGGRPSYLFGGPQNTTNEGGPVPVGYGRLLVGSQVISASYDITDKNAKEEALTI